MTVNTVNDTVNYKDAGGGQREAIGVYNIGMSAGTSGSPVVAQAQGAGNVVAAAVSVTTSATSLAAARSTRGAINIRNNGTVTIYVGASGVTTGAGLPVAPNEVLTLYTTAQVYAITASGTADTRVLEVY